MDMFCYQCEQAAKGTGCTISGVCGKDATVAALQDLLLYATEGVAMYAHRAALLGKHDRDVDVAVVEALFSTVTNVNFDASRLDSAIRRVATMRDRARDLYESAAVAAGKAVESPDGPAQWLPASTLDGLVQQGRSVGIDVRRRQLGDDVVSLQELAAYGLKGAAAYADHAHVLGHDDDGLYAAFHEALDALTRTGDDVETLLDRALRTGEINLEAMRLLDAANTGAYGHPEPTSVRVSPVRGKAILVSGHDLRDLEALLEQTEGEGINIYTHGEMLPANSYPKLKRFAHLAGNYGGAWQDQGKEFDAFPGAILMTTNCIQKPRPGYFGRIFTSGQVAWPGVRHVSREDFGPVIEAAQAAPGFDADAPEQRITIGFGRNAVLSVADAVVAAVKSGAIRHFFLIGGCDGAKSGRNYYTELAERVPQDCAILTLACGKFRFNKLDFGEIGGIPRLLDVGQCNDAYSAVAIALALADAFGCGVNELPLSLVLSWYEQKAVAILLTLLHLGVKNIRIGPSLPAFVSPAVLDVLVTRYGVKPITTADADLEAILGVPEAS